MATATVLKVITTPLQGRDEVAERTMAFRFEKPAGWEYNAGQFVEVTLIDAPQKQGVGETRTFSLASAPEENFLMNATRLTGSDFKIALSTLPLGTKVQIEGPFGDLVLPQDSSRAVVLLTGGIGITPFRSMILDAAKRKLPHKIFLFFSNRRPEDAPFFDELQAVEKENPNYKFIATMTEAEKSARPWNGETGYINKAMLDKYLQGAKTPRYYITGPGGMLNAMHQMLKDAGVSEDDVRTEEFPGY